jgi:hypothetical protein
MGCQGLHLFPHGQRMRTGTKYFTQFFTIRYCIPHALPDSKAHHMHISPGTGVKFQQTCGIWVNHFKKQIVKIVIG